MKHDWDWQFSSLGTNSFKRHVRSDPQKEFLCRSLQLTFEWHSVSLIAQNAVKVAPYLETWQRFILTFSFGVKRWPCSRSKTMTLFRFQTDIIHNTNLSINTPGYRDHVLKLNLNYNIIKILGWFIQLMFYLITFQLI